jgi:hypothetical protein
VRAGVFFSVRDSGFSGREVVLADCVPAGAHSPCAGLRLVLHAMAKPARPAAEIIAQQHLPKTFAGDLPKARVAVLPRICVNQHKQGAAIRNAQISQRRFFTTHKMFSAVAQHTK